MSRLVRRALFAALAGALAGVPLLAAPADTIRARIAGYKQLGAAFKAVNDGLRGEPDLVKVRKAVGQIAGASAAQYKWYPRGSGPQPGIKTAAKVEIWSRGAQFRAGQDRFAGQAAALQRAAAGGDPVAIRAEARKLGATCKACHDAFRAD